MRSNIIAIDVETSNTDRSSICQLGWVVFQNGQIVDEYKTLINPQTTFLTRNTSIHGITENDVKDAPLFKDVLPILFKACKGKILVHHGEFDWQALGHACFVNGLELLDSEWIDTRKLSQLVWLDLDCYKLDHLCKYLGIPLNHHDALDDARAAGNLFQVIESEGYVNREFAIRVFEDDVKHYKLRYPKTGLSTTSNISGKKLILVVEKGLSELQGLIKGIIADDCIHKLELDEFDNWVRLNQYWMSLSPWDELVDTINSIQSSSGENQLELLNDLLWLSQRLGRNYFEGQAVGIMQLEGFFRGVLSDGILNDKEVFELEKWLDLNSTLKGQYIYDNILKLVKDTLEDIIITEEERLKLVSFMLEFTGSLSEQTKSGLLDTDIKVESNSIYSTSEVQFDGCLFCLTGNFENFENKSLVEKKIVASGGSTGKAVTQQLDYLVVGGSGSLDWKYGKYGRKIEKALKYQAKGKDVKIVEESWFVLQLSNLQHS